MKEYPIIFRGDMVNAIRAREKTLTRRVIKDPRRVGAELQLNKDRPPNFPCPYGYTGDHLWVRETWAAEHRFDGHAPRDIPKGVPIHYRSLEPGPSGLLWRPSIFIPRWMSCITLENTGVRIERLQDITEEDAVAEGVGYGFQMNGGWPDYQHIKNGICELTQDSAQMSFATLWESIHGIDNPKAWKSNPWVWKTSFKMIKPAVTKVEG